MLAHWLRNSRKQVCVKNIIFIILRSVIFNFYYKTLLLLYSLTGVKRARLAKPYE